MAIRTPLLLIPTAAAIAYWDWPLAERRAISASLALFG
jgi:hypothetical protein